MFNLESSTLKVKTFLIQSSNVSLIDEFEYEVLKKVISSKRNTFLNVEKVIH
jgi:hypothetical protein